MEQNTKIAYRVSVISIIANCFLSLIKLLTGIFAHSSAMVSDAVHSASDIFSTVVVMIGIRIASKESDHEHPYGHERMECVAAIILSVTLLFTGVMIGWKSLQSILNPEDLVMPGMSALMAAILSIVVKEGMYWYTALHAKKIHSDAMMADAWHHRSDALSSVGAMIGIFGARRGLLWMDGAAGCVIFFFIVKSAMDIFLEAVNKMVDHACDPKTEETMRDCILSDSDVRKIDLLQTRIFGNKVYVDLEISVDGRLSLIEGHEIAERVHKRIETDFPEVKHIMIHVNPSK